MAERLSIPGPDRSVRVEETMTIDQIRLQLHWYERSEKRRLLQERVNTTIAVGIAFGTIDPNDVS